jgi:hypothetical protein
MTTSRALVPVRILRHLRQRAKAQAAIEGLTLTDFMARILNDYLDTYESVRVANPTAPTSHPGSG